MSNLGPEISIGLKSEDQDYRPNY